MPRRLLPFLILLVPLFLLAACGGGDSDEDQVSEVIETAATSSDPADCTELLTQNFLEQTEFESGEAAVKSCEENAKDTSDDPDSVEVSEVEVEGDAATANTAFTGGIFDGQTLALSLISEDGDWKIDRIDSFVDFDQQAFAGAFAAAASTGEDALTPAQSDCIEKALNDASVEEVQQALIGGDQDELGALVGDCFQ